VSFTIDTVAPSVLVTAPGNGITYNTLPTITASASDNSGGSGVASVQFQYSSNGGSTWNNAGSAETSGPFSFTFSSALAFGPYEARAVVTDNAGNSVTSAAANFIVSSPEAYIAYNYAAIANNYAYYTYLAHPQNADAYTAYVNTYYGFQYAKYAYIYLVQGNLALAQQYLTIAASYEAAASSHALAAYAQTNDVNDYYAYYYSNYSHVYASLTAQEL
jgi:hypothetical protein